ncbi:MAG: hypothetical protein CMK92_03290 [Pseudomonas sp.]|nr:hypothetical protein [Pseudomonas sp.]|tara:strand:- start:378 stop:899 length:522 start_codon:yes stop_codon:yes gene_type:complete
MKRSLFFIPLLSATITVPVFAADSLNQEAAQQAYQSSEIDVAVDAARRFPVQTEYVGYEWYNRTTSKSFPMPKLLNTEMNNLVVEGAMGPTAAGTQAADEVNRPSRRAALGRVSKDEDTVETDESVQPDTPEEVRKPREFYSEEIRAQTPSGEMVARRVRSVGDVTATVRPTR